MMREPNEEVIQQILAMFAKLERSFSGDAHSEDDLVKLNETIEFAKNLLNLVERNPYSGAPGELTRVYLASALISRVRYYRGQIAVQTGISLLSANELAGELKLRHPETKENIEKMLVDLNIILSGKMQDAGVMRRLMIEWRCLCFRALSNYDNAILDAEAFVAQNDKDYEGYILLSNCYLDFNDYENALLVANKAIRYANDDLQRCRSYYYRADIYQQSGDLIAYESDQRRGNSFKSGADEIIKIAIGR